MELNEKIITKLVLAAASAREKSYSPYSRFAVGAAVLTDGGKIYSGTNIENASFGLTVCAERVAIFNAITEGEHCFIALAVVAEGAVSPCGACRQVFAEFAPADAQVILAYPDGKVRQNFAMSQLLPDSFKL